MDAMGFISWIVLGGIAGWLASIIMKRNDQMGCIMNIVAGILGAFVGGWVFSLFGSQGVTGFNLQSLLVAFVGAVIVLAVVNLIFGRR
ncbi:MAG TPA: GlsB/YeaQ/YmgE family stress response membrane protein [Anaerolineales bacterium]|nr:GlsB/YeaQ/YmgE family stress response membrane protein [Anaerolineales bacterium]